MNEDIVTRLWHSLLCDPDIDADLTREAIEEIERLRAQLATPRPASSPWLRQIDMGGWF